MLKNKIELFLRENKISIAELERRSNLKSSVIKNILHNRSKNPSINTIVSIAKGLNCTVTELLDLEMIDIKKENYQSVDLFIKCLETVLSYLEQSGASYNSTILIDTSRKLFTKCYNEGTEPSINILEFKSQEQNLEEVTKTEFET